MLQGRKKIRIRLKVFIFFLGTGTVLVKFLTTVLLKVYGLLNILLVLFLD